MKKFQVAFNGILEALKHKAVLIQVILGLITLVAGFVLKLDYYEWLIVIVMIGLVIGFEMLNTAIEKVCDFVEPHYNQQIGIIKDIASGAVLFICLTAMVIGIIVAFNHL